MGSRAFTRRWPGEPGRLEAALRALAPLGFSGCNLTIPHKEAAMALVDRLDPAAARIGAANCIVVEPDGSLTAKNYDGFGFTASLHAAAPRWRAEDAPCAVLGAGGGARAIVAGLIDAGEENPRLQPHFCTRRGAGGGVRAGGSRLSVGKAPRRAFGRGALGQHHQPGDDRPAAARTSRWTRCRRPRWSAAISFTRRWRPSCWASARRAGLTGRRWPGHAAAPGAAGVSAIGSGSCRRRRAGVCAR